jgi:hypothetical protein
MPMLAVMVALSCAPQGDAAEGRVHAWLTCEECTELQLETVLALGDSATPALAEAALGGVPDSLLTVVRTALAQTHASLGGVLPPAALPPEPRYIERYAGNFEALYRKRAAIALALIATTAAQNALMEAGDSAEAGLFRSDVNAAILFARDSIHVP